MTSLERIFLVYFFSLFFPCLFWNSQTVFSCLFWNSETVFSFYFESQRQFFHFILNLTDSFSFYFETHRQFLVYFETHRQFFLVYFESHRGSFDCLPGGLDSTMAGLENNYPDIVELVVNENEWSVKVHALRFKTAQVGNKYRINILHHRTFIFARNSSS